jgi:hypothetical protein
VQLPNGDLAAEDSHRVLRINPVTGARSVLAGAGVGTGPDLNFLEWLTLTQDGQLLVTSANDGVYLMDPATGNHTLLTGPGRGTGTDVGLYREAVQVVPEPGIGLCAF